MVYSGSISLSARGYCDIIDITPEVISIAGRSGITDGVAVIFARGSTCAVTTLEYEPGAVDDLKRAINLIAPEDATYRHNERWGDGNGFSHVRAALMKPSISLPLMAGELSLGTWQQVVFMDFDNRERTRELVVQVIGE